MDDEIKRKPIQPLITSFIILSIALTSFLSYKDILGNFFTVAGGSLRIIEISQIQSVNDLFRIFSEPLASELPFYRPISTLFLGLDYFMWGLNPFGYYLSTLVLHISISISVFFLLRLLTKGNQTIAWLSALFFTIHPILLASVPTLDSRYHITPVLFILLSFLSFLKYNSAVSYKRTYLITSIFFFILALGAGETAVIFPVLIFIYLLIFSSLDNNKLTKKRIIKAAKQSLPYFLVTIIFLLWRGYVLQGVGKYSYPESIFSVFPFLLDVNMKYLMYLLYPVDFLHLNSLSSPLSSLFNPFPGTLKRLIFLFTLFAFFSFLLIYRQTILRMINHNAKGAIKALKILLTAVIILSLMSILFSPLGAHYFNYFIQKVVRHNIDSDQAHVYSARDLIIKTSLCWLYFSLICLIVVHKRENIKRFFIDTADGKLVVFLVFWLSLPLCLYILALHINARYMYIAVIPLSSILSIIIVRGFKLLSKKIRERRFADSFHHFLPTNSTVMTFLIAAGLSISLLANSPLIRTYKKWKYNGNISQMFLHKVSEIIPELSNNSVIHIYNIPSRIFYREGFYFSEATLLIDRPTPKVWINLNYPDNKIKVIIHSNTYITVYPDKPIGIKFEAKKINDNEAVINGILEGEEPNSDFVF